MYDDDIDEVWYKYKVILIGQSGTGKTCIVSRYVRRTFDANTTTSIGCDFSIKTQQFKGQNIKLHIWDTSGQQMFRAIADVHFKAADIVICVFDMTDEKSLDQLIKYWVPHTKQKTERQTPLFFLFGNKCDLIENVKQRKEEIKGKIEELKRKYDCIDCYGSAKNFDDEGITQMMSKIVEYLYEQIPKKELKTSKLALKNESFVKPNRQTVKIKSSIYQDQEKQKRKRCWPF